VGINLRYAEFDVDKRGIEVVGSLVDVSAEVVSQRVEAFKNRVQEGGDFNYSVEHRDGFSKFCIDGEGFSQLRGPRHTGNSTDATPAQGIHITGLHSWIDKLLARVVLGNTPKKAVREACERVVWFCRERD
jgi:hypothetical protein